MICAAFAKFVFVHTYYDKPDDECGNDFSPGVRSEKPKPKPKPKPRFLVGKALAPRPDAEACEDREEVLR